MDRTSTAPARRKRAYNPKSVPAPIRPYYSTCVRVESGPLLFVSGQLGADASGRLVGGGDVKAEAEQALLNIRRIVEENNATMAGVLKVTVYVTDLRYLDEIAAIRMKYFPAEGPASVIVQVSALALGAKVEIDAIVAVGD